MASSPARPWLPRLALLLVSSVVSLSMAEAAFRVFLRRERHEQRSDDAWRRALRNMNRTIYRRSDDPALIYEPAPGRSVPMPYGPAAFNQAGMRDDRQHPTARDGRVRVAIVGDSLVWSEDVALADSLPMDVQRSLGERVEVLPFGVSGYDTAQEEAWYRRAIRPYRPDIVVLVYCINDAIIASGPFYAFATPDEARRKDEQDAWFDRIAPVRAETLEGLAARDESESTFRLIARARWFVREALFQRSTRYTDEYLVAYRDAAHVARVRTALAALHDEIVQDGGVVHFVFSPVLRDWQRYHWMPVHARMLTVARELGYAVHDPLTSWRSSVDPRSLRLAGDSIHYGPGGTRRFGAYIADAIRADVAAASARATTRAP